TNNLVAGSQKPIAQVGAKKAGSARDENGFSFDHAAALARGRAISGTLAFEEARALCDPGWLMSALCNEAPLSTIQPMSAKFGSMTSKYDVDGPPLERPICGFARMAPFSPTARWGAQRWL